MRAPFLTSLLALAIGVGAAGSALAQSPPIAPTAQRPVPPPDPVFLVAQKAFESLDLAQKKAIQRDLVWASNFTGGATGEFGSLTFAAIKRFETGIKSNVDGVLAPQERTALAAVAEKARVAAQFAIETDQPTGMKIGVPKKLFVKRSSNSFGSARFQDKDEKVTLDLQAYKPEDDLVVMFEKGTQANVPGRKITYKLLRPDFFVISGETEKGKFFRRVEKNANAPARGFSIGYDKSLASEVDRYVIVLASTFEAFPSAAQPQTPPKSPVLIATPKGKRLTALAIAPERFITSEKAFKACKSPHIGAVAVEILKAEAGLALAQAKGTKTPSLALTTGEEAAYLIQRDADGEILASPATLENGKVQAPLQEGGAGALVFDKKGGLVGLVLDEPQAKFQVAGIVPLRQYGLTPASDMTKLAALTFKSAEAALRSLSEIAASTSPSVASILCAP